MLDIAPGFALAQALGSGKLAMANPDSVPAGKYGKARWNRSGYGRASSAGRARRERQVPPWCSSRAARHRLASCTAPMRSPSAASRSSARSRQAVIRRSCIRPRCSRTASPSPAGALLDALRSPQAARMGEARLRRGPVIACRSSAPTNCRSSRSAFGSRSSAWFAACRSRSSSPTRSRARIFRARRSSTRSSTCRSCCRRSSSDSRCSCCSAGTVHRQRARAVVRHRLRVSLDRCSARVGDHGISADGARDPPVDRRDRPAPRNRRANARRLAAVGVRIDHAAARAARHHHRLAAVVRAGPRRIRRDDHVRVEHSGRDARRCRWRSTTFTQVPGGDAARCDSASSPSSCRSSRSRHPNG